MTAEQFPHLTDRQLMKMNVRGKTTKTALKRSRSPFTTTCEQCLKVFPCFPYQLRNGIARFCSNACYRITTRKPRALREDSVQLSDGQWTPVSPEDLEWARSLALSSNPSGYALKFHTPFHHLVYERATGLKPLPRHYIDHKNRNPLDNRRENLRQATPRMNAANSSMSSANTSGYIGVSKNHYRFMATVDATRRIYIGTYGSPEEAAWMRDQWAIELHGEFANLNFDYVEVCS